jgi:Ca2+-binding RTX toxin-like protein
MPHRVTREIALIDPSIPEVDAFVAGLRPGIEAILLSASADALTRIGEEVRDRAELQAIHIVAHGRPGALIFSAGTVSVQSLAGHAEDLRAIGDALARDGAVMLWACETGQGKAGERFVEALERMTGAAVGAASGLVGAEAMGGSWHLEVPVQIARQAPLTGEAMRSYIGVLIGQNYQATPQIDHAVQTPENDTVTFTDRNQIQAQDFFDGLGGINKIVLAGTPLDPLDFTKYGADGNLGFHNYQGLVFTDSWNFEPIFSADQFGDGLLSNAFAVTGTPKLKQSIVIEDARNFSAEAWTFSRWSSADTGNTITIKGTNGNDKITGSSQRDILQGGMGSDLLSGGDEDDTIVGGVDADTLTGGGGRNIFHFNAGDNKILIGGKGMKGQVAGYDVITDYKASVFSERSEDLQFDVELSRGNPLSTEFESSLQLHTGGTVKSYKISEGMIRFSDEAKFSSAAELTSLSDVAAATQFLQRNYYGGDKRGALAFTAKIDGTDHTFVWTPIQNGMLIDLANVKADAMVIDGFWIALVDDDAPLQGGGPAIRGNAGDNQIAGTSVDEILIGLQGNDMLGGRGGDDQLEGRRGDDILKGGTGDDVLIGGKGGDKLIGGHGDDRLQGGDGHNKFKFMGRDFGDDAILDFKRWQDQIVLDKSVFPNFKAVKAAMSVDDADHVVIDAGVSSITFFSISKTSALHAFDFDFV